ncbi:MAG: hypothetical protein ACR2GY_03600 [Phycisphaerales bacterium]
MRNAIRFLLAVLLITLAYGAGATSFQQGRGSRVFSPEISTREFLRLRATLEETTPEMATLVDAEFQSYRATLSQCRHEAAQTENPSPVDIAEQRAAERRLLAEFEINARAILAQAGPAFDLWNIFEKQQRRTRIISELQAAGLSPLFDIEAVIATMELQPNVLTEAAALAAGYGDAFDAAARSYEAHISEIELAIAGDGRNESARQQWKDLVNRFVEVTKEFADRIAPVLPLRDRDSFLNVDLRSRFPDLFTESPVDRCMTLLEALVDESNRESFNAHYESYLQRRRAIRRALVNDVNTLRESKDDRDAVAFHENTVRLLALEKMMLRQLQALAETLPAVRPLPSQLDLLLHCLDQYGE